MPEIHIHLHDPSPEAIAAAVEATTPPPKPAPITGLTIRDTGDGAEMVLAPDMRHTLINFGWLPPVDGE
jgi:hypothetical protein